MPISKRDNAGLFILRKLRDEKILWMHITGIDHTEEIRNLNLIVWSIQRDCATPEMRHFLQNSAAEMLLLNVKYANAARFVEDYQSFWSCQQIVRKCRVYLEMIK